MSNLNIIDKLDEEKKEVTIAEGKTYEINCGAKTMLKVQESFNKNSSFDSMFDALELLIGKKGRKEIYDMDLTVSQLKKVILAIMAQVNEISYEEMEQRFQNATK